MTSGMKTIIFPVADIGKAKKLYGTLFGTEPYQDEEYYVGFEVDGQNLGLDPHGRAKGMEGPIGYWHVDDIDKSLVALVGAGATTRQQPTDVGGGKLIAAATDLDGNVIGLLQMP